MDSQTEPERPNRPETPTADAAAEFLKGVKEIHERQRVESSVDPEAARIQSKEFAEQMDEIINSAQNLPADDEGPWNTAIPGIWIVDTGDNDHGVIIKTKEADLPVNPLRITEFAVHHIHEDTVLPLNQLGVTPKHELFVTHKTSPDEIPPFRSTPIEGIRDYMACYFFDEQGNYLKLFSVPPDITTDLEEVMTDLPDKSPIDDKTFKTEMTPEDFEFVGMSLNLIKSHIPNSNPSSTQT